MNAERAQQMSYELYQELANELCAPIDPNLTPEVRQELYQSKLVYLRNLYEQAFRETNGNGETRFTQEDLLRIRESVGVTSNFLRGLMLERLESSMRSMSNRIEKKAS